jgi:[acyl-carrier-protein] S-malonyltransferase
LREGTHLTKRAILFAGQGAQKTGMGKGLYHASPAAKKIFDRAESRLPGIKEMCFSAGQEVLNQTANTQPAVYTVDVAAFAAYREAGGPMDAAAGFSLGEYAALCCAGVFTFEQGLDLVIKRAAWMQEAAQKTGGGMAAVLGKTGQEVDEMVSAVCAEGILQAVNYNCPGQTVVAGDAENLDQFLAYCKENKVKAVRLPVSGAFHSKAMEGVAHKIAEAARSIEFMAPDVPVYSNMLARPYAADEIKKTLAAQTASPVYFEQILRSMMRSGYNTFVEVGPGNTLAGFVKRTDGQATVYNVNDEQTLGQAAQAIREEK